MEAIFFTWMDADPAKTEQASFRPMSLACENESRLTVKITANPRKFSFSLPIGLFFLNFEATA